ncbi:ubiquinone biosynthesis protein COQ9, mitochondrial-like isoform X2 [Pecten maximus]|uniref:ubiquinone biosynthesis protein COQ9, mitochondrial-like isoform X2 n=1 Tax=Pecten maximus TaxID=6579 RepID=UPI001458C9E2|nr:ubiquinone biosynthesis protein COQ9, mitochondrial-like isoform X2 [Pecten maximus]
MAAPCARCRAVISSLLFRRLAVGNLRYLSTHTTPGNETEGKSFSGSRTDEQHQAGDNGNNEPFNTTLEEDYRGDQEESETEADIKNRILTASMAFVPEHGWSKTALAAGAAVEGLPSVAHGMFPRGGAHLASFFYQNCNKELAAKLKREVESQEEGEAKPSTRVFITNAVETRLRMVMPYLDNWHQAMAIQALPENIPYAWTNLLQLTDDIWYYAGDRSHDFNWYTKRVSLAGVYKSTEIYMIQDKSANLQDTWEFLDNRIDNLVTVGECARSAKSVSGMTTEGLAGIFKMGQNILGMNFKSRSS